MARTKPYDVVLKIYRQAYKESEPSVDFDELVANTPYSSFVDGKWVEHPEADAMSEDERRMHVKYNGWKKKIPFEDYYLDNDRYSQIVESIIKRHRSLSESEKKGVRFEAYLGCGPSSCKKEKKDD